MAKERRLIDLDEAMEATRKEIYWTESRAADVRCFLIQQPRVDAVEVVRCKDCKYSNHCTIELELAEYWMPLSEHFCSYGERKENQ